jgi:hypothetical protein
MAAQTIREAARRRFVIGPQNKFDAPGGPAMGKSGNYSE